MTVLALNSRVVLSASAGATVLSVPFPVQRGEDLVVWKTPSGGSPTLLTYLTHYSVTVRQINEESCTVTLVVPADAGDSYLIYRIVGVQQELSLRNQGVYLPATQEAELDRIVMMIQQLDSLLSTLDPSLARALLLTVDSVIGDGQYDALSNRISNLEDGTDTQDAATLGQLQAAVAGVVGGGSGSTRVIVTAATLPVAGIAYDFAATGIEYIVRDSGFPDVIKRCLRLSTGNTYDWFVVVQGDR